MSLTENQLEVIDNDDLALLSRRFTRFHDNRMNRNRGHNTCYNCGKPRHYAIECPEKFKQKAEYKQENHNSSKNDYKERGNYYKSKYKEEKRKTRRKYTDHKNKSDRRAMVARASDIDSDSGYSSSSSSEEGDTCSRHRNKDAGWNINRIYLMANKPGINYCVMTHNSKSKRSHSYSDSDSDSDAKVTDMTPEELAAEVLRLNGVLEHQDKVLKDCIRERKSYRSQLADAKAEIDRLHDVVNVTDEKECDDCDAHMSDVVSLRFKCAELRDKLDDARKELDEVNCRPALLGACKSCPALQSQLDDALSQIAALEKTVLHDKSTIPECSECFIHATSNIEMKNAICLLEDENRYARTMLSWISAREPQLCMIIAAFKRADGIALWSSLNSSNFEWAYDEKFGETSGEKEKIGDIHAPLQKAPKNPEWKPKPNHLLNKLDTMLDIAPPKPKHKENPKPQPKAKLQDTPKPKQAKQQCVYCKRDGHREEFCFHKRRDSKREREWGNQDRYHPSRGVPEPRRAPPP